MSESEEGLGCKGRSPTIGILTALELEFVAVKAMLDEVRDYDVPDEAVRYVVGQLSGTNGRVHPIVLALGDVGESFAAIYSTQLFSHFPNLESLFMVGIAGGVPNPSMPDEHVRLGDIVVSNQYGVVQFDLGKQTTHDFQYRPAPRPPSASLLKFARHLRTREMEGQRPWEPHLRRGQASLGWNRPPASDDFLGEAANPAREIRHPKDPKRQDGQPRIFFGLIASSNTLLKNAVKRDELRDKFGAKAIEMETAGLADAAWVRGVGYVGVRGICDYCDANKNDTWQPYAALAAAAYVRALLESIPGAEKENKSPKAVKSVNAELDASHVHILDILLESHEAKQSFMQDKEISQLSGISLEDIRHNLDFLSHHNIVLLKRKGPLYFAQITSKGKQILKNQHVYTTPISDPEMLSAIAELQFKLRRVITDSELAAKLRAETPAVIDKILSFSNRGWISLSRIGSSFHEKLHNN